MEYRTLDITVMSADNLKDVNMMSKMDVYVAVSVSGDPRTLRRTPVHKDGGKSPRWNHRLSLPVSDNVRVVFKVFSDRVLGDREIGEVSVPVKELLDAAGNGGDGGERVVEYQVRTVSGKNKGTLKFSYKFGEKIASAPTPHYAAPPHYASAPPPQYAAGPQHGYAAAPQHGYAAAPPPPQYAAAPKTDYAAASKPDYASAPPPHYAAASKPDYAAAPPPHYADEGKSSGEPVTAYPAHPYPPPPQQGYGYPPPQQGYGYPPPQHGYGYPPPQQGYGYPPPQQGYGYGGVPPKKKKQGMGGGLGLGLGAGLLGGLLVGDMISDVGDYDGGFDGGFDF